MVFVAYKCGLLQLHGDSFDIFARVQRNDRRCIGTQSLPFGRNDHQNRVELREHVLDECPKTVHHTEHTDHSRRDDRYGCCTNTGNDINSIVPFL